MFVMLLNDVHFFYIKEMQNNRTQMNERPGNMAHLNSSTNTSY